MSRLIFVLGLIFSVFLVSLVFAGIPKLINYQGMLTQSDGKTPVTNANYPILFSIYNISSGGSSLWSHTYNVAVTNGLFNVILGDSGAPINLSFDVDYWLELKVGADPPLSPRIKLTSVGYAYRASIADSAMVAVSAPTGGGWTDDGKAVRLTNSSDSVGIGTTNPQSKLHISGGDIRMDYGSNIRMIQGNGYHSEIFRFDNDLQFCNFATGYIDFRTDTSPNIATSRLYIANNGKIGIGTINPNEEMEIYRDQDNWTNLRLTNPSGGTDAGSAIYFYEGGCRAYIAAANSGNTDALGGPGSLAIQTYDGPIHIRTNFDHPVSILPYGGNVGIGTTDPSRKLHIVGVGPRILIEASSGNPEVNFQGAGDTGAQRWALYKETISGDLRFYQNGDKVTIQNSTGNVGIGTTSPGSYLLAVNGTAAKPGGGSWSTFSDERLKDVRANYEYGLSEISQLKPVRYRYQEGNALGLPSDQEFVGLVAQEVEKVIPDAVKKNDKGYLMVNNDPIIWAMLNAIKELKAENEELKKRIEALESK